MEFNIIYAMNARYPQLDRAGWIDFNKNGTKDENEVLKDIDDNRSRHDELDYYAFIGTNAKHIEKQILNRAVNSNIKGLADRKAKVRIAAADALGQLRDKRAVKPLITALRSEAFFPLDDPLLKDLGLLDIEIIKTMKYEAQGKVAYSLGEIGDKRAVKPLINALQNKSFYARGIAALALGMLGDRSAVESLIAVLQDKKAEDKHRYGEGSALRGLAAKALGELGDKRALKPLISALKDEENCGIYGHTLWALTKIDDKKAKDVIIPLIDDGRGCFYGPIDALGDLGGDKRAVEPLIDILNNGRLNKRRRAAYVLAEIGDARAINPTIKLFKDQATRLHKYSTKIDFSIVDDIKGAIIKFGATAVQPTISILNDENPTIRWYAATILGEIGDERAIEPLKDLRGDGWFNQVDSNPKVVTAADQAIKEIESRIK